MKLSLKLAAAMALIAAIVLVVSDWMALRREVVLIEADRGREVQEVAVGLARLCELATVGDPAAIVDQLDRHVGGMSIRWVPADPQMSVDDRVLPRLGVDGEGLEFVSAVAVIHREDGIAGAVQVQASMSQRDEFIDRFLAKNAVAVVLVTLFCGLVALVSGHMLVGARVEELVDKARRVGKGDFSKPLPLQGGDELTQLAQAFNEMTSQLAAATRRATLAADAALQAQVQLRHADRLTTVGQLAAGVAHELGTPLNVISGRAAMLQERTDSDKDARDATTIREQAARITSIVRRMLDFARKSEPELRPGDLGEVARECVELVRTTARKSDVELICEASDDDLMGAFDPAHIRQVITNLVVNSVQAQPDGGKVIVQVSRGRCDDEDHLHVVVSDDGPGIREADLERVFDPFFTTKEPGAGTGLGLSIVHGIVKEHGGSVTVQNRAGEGAVFTIHLPPSQLERS